MPQAPPKPRVSGGIPWWIWLLLVIVTGSVVTSGIIRMIPEDPEKLYQDGLAAFDQAGGAGLGALIQRLDRFPEYASRVQILKGYEQIATARPLKAIPFFEKVKDDPLTRQKALSGLGMVYRRVDDRKQAAEYLRLAIQENPDDRNARGSLSALLDEAHALELLTAELREIIDRKLATSPAIVLRQRGKSLFELDRYEEAAVDFEEALKAEVDKRSKAEITEELVRCLQLSGQFEKSLTLVDEIAANINREGHRTAALLELGRIDEAKAALDKALPGAEMNAEIQILRCKWLLTQPKETAAAAMHDIEQTLIGAPRNLDLYRAALELARHLNRDQDSELFAENVRQLELLQESYKSQRDLAARNLDDARGRIAAGDLAAELGDIVAAQKWYAAAEKVDPVLRPEISTKNQLLYSNKAPLIAPDRINLYGFEAMLRTIMEGVDALDGIGRGVDAPPDAKF